MVEEYDKLLQLMDDQLTFLKGSQEQIKVQILQKEAKLAERSI